MNFELLENEKYIRKNNIKINYKIKINNSLTPNIIGIHNKKLIINLGEQYKNNFVNLLEMFINLVYSKFKIDHNLYLNIEQDNFLNIICKNHKNIKYINRIFVREEKKDYNLYLVKTNLFISSLKKQEENINYYIVKSKYLNEENVSRIMSKSGNWKEFNPHNKTKKNPDYIHVDQHYSNDKSLWKYKAPLKSLVDLNSDSDSIDNKFNLVENLKKLNNNKLDAILLKQYKINMYDLNKNINKIKDYQSLFHNSKVWIFKFIYSHGGENIIVLDSFDKFKEYVLQCVEVNKNKWENLDYQKYKNIGKTKKGHYFIEWVLQEYIDNPLLYENKKFHLRGYFLYHKTDKGNKGYVLNNHCIATAKQEYQKSDYLNKLIHDTHFHSASKNIDFKPDISEVIGKVNTTKIDEQINLLFQSILKIIKTPCFPENKYCYHFFASDIIITSDYKIKLIEINKSPGLPTENYTNKISDPNFIFQEIVRNIVDKHYTPINPPTIPEKNYFIEL